MISELLRFLNQSTLAGQAEGAPHPASYLCGYTEGQPVLLRYQDTLDPVTVLEGKLKLLVPDYRALSFDLDDPADIGPLEQKASDLLR